MTFWSKRWETNDILGQMKAISAPMIQVKKHIWTT